MPWHTGRTVGRTIYMGDGPDDLIGIMDSRELAAIVVRAVNNHYELVVACELLMGFIEASGLTAGSAELLAVHAALAKAKVEQP